MNGTMSLCASRNVKQDPPLSSSFCDADANALQCHAMPCQHTAWQHTPLQRFVKRQTVLQQQMQHDSKQHAGLRWRCGQFPWVV